MLGGVMLIRKWYIVSKTPKILFPSKKTQETRKWIVWRVHVRGGFSLSHAADEDFRRRDYRQDLIGIKSVHAPCHLMWLSDAVGKKNATCKQRSLLKSCTLGKAESKSF